jgi:hypothetical protein
MPSRTEVPAPLWDSYVYALGQFRTSHEQGRRLRKIYSCRHDEVDRLLLGQIERLVRHAHQTLSRIPARVDANTGRRSITDVLQAVPRPRKSGQLEFRTPICLLLTSLLPTVEDLRDTPEHEASDERESREGDLQPQRSVTHDEGVAQSVIFVSAATHN